MRTARRVFLLIGVAAAIVLGVYERVLGGSVLKGFATDFVWRADPQNGRLVLSSEPGGVMQCWISLRVSHSPTNFTARTAQGTALRVDVDQSGPESELIELAKDGQSPKSPFEWPAGVDLYVYPQDGNVTGMAVEDWSVYPSAKSPDSLQRAKARKIGFWVFLALLVLAIVGGILEALERLAPKEAAVKPEHCIRSVIRAVEVADRKQTERMQSILTKVLLEDAPLKQELSLLTYRDQYIFMFTITNQVAARLQRFIDELRRYMGYLKP